MDSECFLVFYFTLFNFIEPFVLCYCVLWLYFFFALSFFLGNSFILLHYLFQYFVMIHVIELDFFLQYSASVFYFIFCDFLLYCWYWIFWIYGFYLQKQPINIRGWIDYSHPECLWILRVTKWLSYWKHFTDSETKQTNRACCDADNNIHTVKPNTDRRPQVKNTKCGKWGRNWTRTRGRPDQW